MDAKVTIVDRDVLEFVIFCVESVAERLGKDPGNVYDALVQQSDILSHYIVAQYETLHTQGKEYIVEEILNVMRERGVQV